MKVGGNPDRPLGTAWCGPASQGVWDSWLAECPQSVTGTRFGNARLREVDRLQPVSSWRNQPLDLGLQGFVRREESDPPVQQRQLRQL